MKSTMEMISQLDSPEADKQSEFDIADAMNRMIRSRGQHIDDTFYEIIARIDQEDLQRVRIEELRQRYKEITDELVADPYNSFRSEVELLEKMYDGRSLRGQQYDGREVVHFGTRNQQRDAIDIHITVTTGTEGQKWMRLQTNLQGQLDRDEPCIITAGPEGQFKVEQRMYRRGQWRYQELPIEDDSKGEHYLKAVLADTLWAAHLNYTRQPEEMVENDRQARQLLIQRMRDERTL